MVERDYKYYLSLENSVCKDYVTEKMFDALKHNVIPVVLGGANYSSIFPERSFINMNEFRSMKSLAHFLLELSKNTKEYMKYFNWQTEYSIQNTKEDNNQAHCQLCDFLHNGNSRVVANLSDWWVKQGNCGNSDS